MIKVLNISNTNKAVEMRKRESKRRERKREEVRGRERIETGF